MDLDATIFVEHFRYHRWASGLLLDASMELPVEELYLDRKASHGGVFSTLSHIYLADRLWLARLRSDAQMTYGEAPAAIEALRSAWLHVQDGLIDWAERQGDWGRMLTYRRMNGEAFQNPVWELALHVVNHSTLHRGQAMAMLRQTGRTPPATDLFFYRLAHPRSGAAGVGR